MRSRIILWYQCYAVAATIVTHNRCHSTLKHITILRIMQFLSCTFPLHI